MFEMKSMADTLETGMRGEEIALGFLISKGMVLRERNWRWNHKEIDLIMEDDRLHIVEVKSLNAPALISPSEHVDLAKQRNLAYAANHYVLSRGITKETQFDIVSILFAKDGSYTLEYIPEAFLPIFYYS